MVDEAIVTARTRKLYFDDYTYSFYFESKVESLERTCRQRLEINETINKGYELQMRSRHKQVDNAQSLVVGKLTKEMNTLRKSLKDMVAYRRVLDHLSKEKADMDANSLYGNYGLMPDYEDVNCLIEQEKIRMGPSYKRVKAAKALLEQRRIMEVVTRTARTPDVLGHWHNRDSSAQRNVTSCQRGDRSKLSLPPIAARRYHRRNSRTSFAASSPLPTPTPQSAGVCPRERKSSMTAMAEGEDSLDPAAIDVDIKDSMMPSIFVTQNRTTANEVAA